MIEFSHISHHYPGKPTDLILDDISFTIQKGECVGLTGPSGCGKSTLAHIGAGHIRPAAGRVLVNGRDLTYTPNRKIFLIHQEPDLFPWQKVAKQVAFAMAKPAAAKVEELLGLVKLRGFENFYPGQLSGGMKKRLALARALALDPELLILDESFSSLDSELKEELYKDLRQIWQRTGTTILLITHHSNDLEHLAHREIKLSATHPTTVGAIIDLAAPPSLRANHNMPPELGGRETRP